MDRTKHIIAMSCALLLAFLMGFLIGQKSAGMPAEPDPAESLTCPITIN